MNTQKKVSSQLNFANQENENPFENLQPIVFDTFFFFQKDFTIFLPRFEEKSERKKKFLRV